MSLQAFRSVLVQTWLTLIAVLLLLSLGRSGWLPAAVAKYVADAGNDGESERAIEAQTQNYYEVLVDVDRGRWGRSGVRRLLVSLFNMESDPDDDAGGNWVNIKQTGLVEDSGDPFLKYELVPGADETFMGVNVRVNRWRMRDIDYPRVPEEGTFRIAFIEASNGMGYGVPQEAIFCEVLEKRLNDEVAGLRWKKFEVLNFSVGGYQMLDRLYVVDERIMGFKPHLVLVCTTMHDLRWAIHTRLVDHIVDGRDLHFDFLRRIVADAGVGPHQSETRMSQKLKQRRVLLASGCFEELARISAREATPIVVVNLRLRVDSIHPDMLRQSELARKAGLVCIELFDAYEGQNSREVYLRPSDAHPTIKGHALLADELWSDLMNEPQVRSLLVGEQVETSPRGGS